MTQHLCAEHFDLVPHDPAKPAPESYRTSPGDRIDARLPACSSCNSVIDTAGRCSPNCQTARNLKARIDNRVARTG